VRLIFKKCAFSHGIQTRFRFNTLENRSTPCRLVAGIAVVGSGPASSKMRNRDTADHANLEAWIAGAFFYLYLIVDIWSGKIVDWELHAHETADFAAQMLERTVWGEKCLTSPLVLHADNGCPMKGASPAQSAGP
jgi:transposase InsO family protein